jgi:chromosome segregation ATPase
MFKLIYDEPPCKIEDILNINISYINLQNFLNSLVNNDKEFYSKIDILSNKINELDDLNMDLKLSNNRIKYLEEKANSLESTLENHQKKILELEERLEVNYKVNKNIFIKSNYFIHYFLEN